MTRLLVAVQLRVLEIMASEQREERGQGTLEYVGMVAVAVILVLAVLAAARQVNLGTFLTEQLKKVTG